MASQCSQSMSICDITFNCSGLPFTMKPQLIMPAYPLTPDVVSRSSVSNEIDGVEGDMPCHSEASLSHFLDEALQNSQLREPTYARSYPAASATDFVDESARCSLWDGLFAGQQVVSSKINSGCFEMTAASGANILCLCFFEFL